jgi:sugar O-acyltransferase (sialic acid O-acetyltransferase NeuD family)
MCDSGYAGLGLFMMQLLIYCAGGFGKEVMDIARRLNKKQRRWERIAYLDDLREERVFYGADVYRLDDVVGHFCLETMEVVIAHGEPFVRKALREKIEAVGIRLATVIDNTAVISETAKIGFGAIIFPGCYVSSNTTIGHNVAIIAGSMVGHDAILGDNCVVSGQVNIGGACSVGSESYIGMGAQIKDHTSVGWAAIVGMGSIVFKSIPDEVVALGNPCRPMRPNTDKKVFL